MFISLKSAHPRHYILMFCFKKYMKIRKSVIFNGHFGKLKMPITAFFVVKNDDHIRYTLGTKYFVPSSSHFHCEKWQVNMIYIVF